jgi:RNA polymerase sigma-70 factor (ECF subfamily)
MAQILSFPRKPEMVADAFPAAPQADASAPGDAAWSLWMRQGQAGDRVAYERLLQAIVPYLSAIARRHLGHPDAVDDAVQDILLIVHSVRHTYEPDRPLKPWLLTIARRHCIDLERRRLRRLRHEGGGDEAIAAQADSDPSPEDALGRQQASAGMRRAVAELPPRQRTALELMKLRELSAREASASSGLSVSALKVACHRALKSLGRKLREPPHD